VGVVVPAVDEGPASVARSLTDLKTLWPIACHSTTIPNQTSVTVSVATALRFGYQPALLLALVFRVRMRSMYTPW
jgi:hypothetical protein